MGTLNTDERNLNLVQGLYFLGDSLAGIFVTVFIFSHSDFGTTLIFFGLSLFSLLICYVLSGRLMERIPSGTVVRLGLFIAAFFYFLLFLLKNEAVWYIVPLALLRGIATGLFWSGLNLNQYVFSQRHTRIHFFGSQSVINNAVRAAGPVIGGFLIARLGTHELIGFNSAYAILFLVTALVYFFAAAFIGKLPQHELLRVSYSKFFSYKRSAAWKRVLWEHAIFGSYDILSGTVITVLMFTVVKGEFMLGSVQTILAAVMAVGAAIATKMLKKVNSAFWIGSVGVSLGFIGFAVFPNLIGLWIFIIVYGLTATFLPTWMLTEWFHTLDRSQYDWRNNFHVLIERDIALGVPRVVSYGILFYFVQYGDQIQLAWNTLYILPVFPIVLGILFALRGRASRQL